MHFLVYCLLIGCALPYTVIAITHCAFSCLLLINWVRPTQCDSLFACSKCTLCRPCSANVRISQTTFSTFPILVSWELDQLPCRSGYLSWQKQRLSVCFGTAAISLPLVTHRWNCHISKFDSCCAYRSRSSHRK